MSKSAGQKLKLLYLKQILEQQSDEQHPLTISDIIRELDRCGVAAERKSIYDDIEALQQYGMDIVVVKGRSNAYFLGQRHFEMPELKLLVDAVQSAQFITEKKSSGLIRKLSSLTSRHEAALLARQVYVQGRAKTGNEGIYYNVDILHTAIAKGRQIRCKYFEWAVDKTARRNVRRQWRRGGATYYLSPWAMVWDNENYYLLAFDATAGIIKHYRVDKLDAITVLDTPREGREIYDKLDIAAYTKRRFGMFGGREEDVRIRFANRYIGVVVDRFGRDADVTLDGEAHFILRCKAVISPQFFSWLMGFSDEAQLLAPGHAVQEFAETLTATAHLYQNSRA